MKNRLAAGLFLFCIVSVSHATIEFVASGTSAKGVDVAIWVEKGVVFVNTLAVE